MKLFEQSSTGIAQTVTPVWKRMDKVSEVPTPPKGRRRRSRQVTLFVPGRVADAGGRAESQSGEIGVYEGCRLKTVQTKEAMASNEGVLASLLVATGTATRSRELLAAAVAAVWAGCCGGRRTKM